MTWTGPLDLSTDSLPRAPLDIYRHHVEAGWVDYNGHMNVACYLVAFDRATDCLFDLIDVGIAYAKRSAYSMFVLETHVIYRQELKGDDPIRVSVQLLDVDEKRLHAFYRMYHAREGYEAAACEQLVMHVGLETRRSAPFGAEAAMRIAAIRAAHAGLETPADAGRVIGIRRRAAEAAASD